MAGVSVSPMVPSKSKRIEISLLAVAFSILNQVVVGEVCSCFMHMPKRFKTAEREKKHTHTNSRTFQSSKKRERKTRKANCTHAYTGRGAAADSRGTNERASDHARQERQEITMKRIRVGIMEQ